MTDSYKSHGIHEGSRFVDLHALVKSFPGLPRLPVSTRILIENLARNENGTSVTADDIAAVASFGGDWDKQIEIAYRPSRVLMQDYAGMPALIDLAALREMMAERGLDPARLNPSVPSDLVVDHSVIAHRARDPHALAFNENSEFAENEERFAFLKWAQQAFSGLRVVPPGQGIVHQVHIEHLAEIVSLRRISGEDWLLPDTVIGTDSHTTMVNGLGVLGWGVGGIEAEAVMLDEPISMLVPKVLGVRLGGSLAPGILATDLVLTLTELLRKRGVVGTILEFFGPGVAALPVADRTTIANMAPEFGATAAFFPSDARTCEYLALTGRAPEAVRRAESYLRANGLWFDPDFVPDAADVIEFDLSAVRRTVSGPSRPEERRDLGQVPAAMGAAIGRSAASGDGLCDGDIVIAAITSCTNTSNPEAMIAAGLLARNARRRGLSVPYRIKTSLAPGSRVVTDYLARAGLLGDLKALGFDIVGYGCTTCVGNSGELSADIIEAIDSESLCVAAILSGNRNFEGRIHPKVKANFLASPPLVVAYALAGTMLRDLASDPIGTDDDGRPVLLADIWPHADEIAQTMSSAVRGELFTRRYADILSGTAQWEALPANEGALYRWNERSTYLRQPPFFSLAPLFAERQPLLRKARPLLILGDMVTTDHISPVGSIASDSPAADFLRQSGTAAADFNAYGARRGNHDVMMLGTFANVRLKNAMAGRAGPFTTLMPEERETTVFEASQAYGQRGEDVIVVAGRMYGAGSARDWAAKGTRLLGVKAVLAESFERIHRSNLVRMGVLPLEFAEADACRDLQLGGGDVVSIDATIEALAPRARLAAALERPDGSRLAFGVVVRADTLDELRYLRDGGILPSVARQFLSAA